MLVESFVARTQTQPGVVGEVRSVIPWDSVQQRRKREVTLASFDFSLLRRHGCSASCPPAAAVLLFFISVNLFDNGRSGASTATRQHSRAHTTCAKDVLMTCFVTKHQRREDWFILKATCGSITGRTFSLDGSLDMWRMTRHVHFAGR